ncbi:MAG: hypothetical protein WBB34_17670 [Xanthobacteraceae bacterium]
MKNANTLGVKTRINTNVDAIYAEVEWYKARFDEIVRRTERFMDAAEEVQRVASTLRECENENHMKADELAASLEKDCEKRARLYPAVLRSFKTARRGLEKLLDRLDEADEEVLGPIELLETLRDVIAGE